MAPLATEPAAPRASNTKGHKLDKAVRGHHRELGSFILHRSFFHPFPIAFYHQEGAGGYVGEERRSNPTSVTKERCFSTRRGTRWQCPQRRCCPWPCPVCRMPSGNSRVVGGGRRVLHTWVSLCFTIRRKRNSPRAGTGICREASVDCQQRPSPHGFSLGDALPRAEPPSGLHRDKVCFKEVNPKCLVLIAFPGGCAKQRRTSPSKDLAGSTHGVVSHQPNPSHPTPPKFLSAPPLRGEVRLVKGLV